MPQLIGAPDSDDDMIPDVVPAKARREEPEYEDEEDNEVADEVEDEDEEEDEDEYRVEKILEHGFAGDDNHAVYLIKWLGFEKKADQTWEPEENLTGAPELLAEYHAKIGGPPVHGAATSESARKGKGKKRGASNAFAVSPAPSSEKKQKTGGRKSNGLAAEDEGKASKVPLPAGQWENSITRITSVLQEEIPSANGRGKKEKRLTVYVQWDSGDKTQHPMTVIRRKCPQKLLDYYEQHLVFSTPESVDESPVDGQE